MVVVVIIIIIIRYGNRINYDDPNYNTDYITFVGDPQLYNNRTLLTTIQAFSYFINEWTKDTYITFTSETAGIQSIIPKVGFALILSFLFSVWLRRKEISRMKKNVKKIGGIINSNYNPNVDSFESSLSSPSPTPQSLLNPKNDYVVVARKVDRDSGGASPSTMTATAFSPSLRNPPPPPQSPPPQSNSVPSRSPRKGFLRATFNGIFSLSNNNNKKKSPTIQELLRTIF